MDSDFLQITDKTLLVTGASSGIGRAIAIMASEQGARVALLSRSRESLDETRSMMHGDGHLVVLQDLRNLEDLGATVRRIAHELGGLDGLAHAAGAHSTTPLRAVHSKDVSELFDLNVASTVMLAKAFRHREVRRAPGSIVFLSSAVGLVGQPGVSIYSATKGAILSLTKSLALELARDQIRVNCVVPGVVLTPMADSLKAAIGDKNFQGVVQAHPLGLGQPEDVAAAVLFLLSGAAKWITGSSLVVDGGYTAQ